MKKVYESADLSVIEKNEISNRMLQAKKENDVVKKIRHKIINNL